MPVPVPLVGVVFFSWEQVAASSTPTTASSPVFTGSRYQTSHGALTLFGNTYRYHGRQTVQRPIHSVRVLAVAPLLPLRHVDYELLRR